MAKKSQTVLALFKMKDDWKVIKLIRCIFFTLEGKLLSI